MDPTTLFDPEIEGKGSLAIDGPYICEDMGKNDNFLGLFRFAFLQFDLFAWRVPVFYQC